MIFLFANQLAVSKKADSLECPVFVCKRAVRISSLVASQEKLLQLMFGVNEHVGSCTLQVGPKVAPLR